MNEYPLPDRLSPDEIIRRLATPAPEHQQRKLMTPGQVAEAFQCDPKTVTRWAKEGKLTSFRTLGGHRRYDTAEVEKLIEDSREERRTHG